MPEGPFVPLMAGPAAKLLVARATLEAAGIETRTDARNDLAAVVPDPMTMTLLVREGDVEAARKTLKMA